MKARHLEMEIVHHHVVDARAGDGTREMRFPYPLGEPHAAGVVADLLPDIVRKRPYLSGLVLIRQHRQDRFIETARQYLDPPIRHEPPDRFNKIRVFLLEEPVEDARVVERHPDLGMPLQHLDERKVGLLVRLLGDEVEVPHRLVVMNGEDELDLGHFSGKTRYFRGVGIKIQTGILAPKRRKVNQKRVVWLV